jgi:hypothetical protein
MALLRECYDNKVSVKNAWREIQQRQGVDPDTVTPEITTPEVAEEMQAPKSRGGRPRATIDAFMQKVEDKSGVEIDQDPAFRNIVEQVYNAGGSVKDAVESVMGSSMFEKQEEAKIVPAVKTTTRKPRGPKAVFNGPNLTDDMIGIPSVSDDSFLASLGIGVDEPEAAPAPKVRKPRSAPAPVSNELDIDIDADPFADETDVDVFAPEPAPAPAPAVTRKPRPAPAPVPEPEPAEEDPDLADYGDDFMGGDVEPEPEPEPAPKVTRQVKAPAPAPAPKSGMSARDRAKMLTKNAFDPTDISPDAIDFDDL